MIVLLQIRKMPFKIDLNLWMRRHELSEIQQHFNTSSFKSSFKSHIHLLFARSCKQLKNRKPLKVLTTKYKARNYLKTT